MSCDFVSTIFASLLWAKRVIDGVSRPRQPFRSSTLFLRPISFSTPGRARGRTNGHVKSFRTRMTDKTRLGGEGKMLLVGHRMRTMQWLRSELTVIRNQRVQPILYSASAGRGDSSKGVDRSNRPACWTPIAEENTIMRMVLVPAIHLSTSSQTAAGVGLSAMMS